MTDFKTINNLGLNGNELVTLTPEALKTDAMHNTGFDDFGESDFNEPLNQLLHSIHKDSELTTLGNILAKWDIQKLLEGRLCIEEAYKRHSEIESEEIASPIFIMGLPRSGTSILLEMLAQDSAHRAPLMWEAKYPAQLAVYSDMNKAKLIRKADKELKIWQSLDEKFAAIHERSAKTPAECIELIAYQFFCYWMSQCHNAVSYKTWLAQNDWLPAYRYYKRILKLLQWQGDKSKRWVLKSPSHMGQLDKLAALFPDATIIHIHRDPLKCAASASSLSESVYGMRSDSPWDSRAFTQHYLDALPGLLDYVIHQKEAEIIPQERYVDIRYADFMSNPIEAIASIYDQLKTPFAKDARSAMTQYLDKKPQNRDGVHRYGLAGGIDIPKVRERYKKYQDYYQVPSEFQHPRGDRPARC